jgi:hypothetical protein
MSAQSVAWHLIWNQCEVVARPMAVINLRTRARLTDKPFARAAAALLTAVAAVVAVATAVAACGTATTPAAGSAGSHAPAAKATLTIKATDKAIDKVTRWTLRCDPPGGTMPDPAAACKTLLGPKDTLIPIKRDIMCPMIMISGKQIIVDGTWFGQKVHRVIIDGGCDLPIFNNLAKGFGANVFN